MPKGNCKLYGWSMDAKIFFTTSFPKQSSNMRRGPRYLQSWCVVFRQVWCICWCGWETETGPAAVSSSSSSQHCGARAREVEMSPTVTRKVILRTHAFVTLLTQLICSKISKSTTMLLIPAFLIFSAMLISTMEVCVALTNRCELIKQVKVWPCSEGQHSEADAVIRAEDQGLPGHGRQVLAAAVQRHQQRRALRHQPRQDRAVQEGDILRVLHDWEQCPLPRLYQEVRNN